MGENLFRLGDAHLADNQLLAVPLDEPVQFAGHMAVVAGDLVGNPQGDHARPLLFQGQGVRIGAVTHLLRRRQNPLPGLGRDLGIARQRKGDELA